MSSFIFLALERRIDELSLGERFGQGAKLGHSIEVKRQRFAGEFALRIGVLFFLFLSPCVLPKPLEAQDKEQVLELSTEKADAILKENNEDASSLTAEKSDPREEKLASLSAILASLEKVSSQIKEAQRELRSASAKGRETALNERILLLSTEREALVDNFNIIASETDLRADSSTGLTADIDWGEELKELLAPLFREVKRLTSRPREIELLRSRIAFYHDRAEEIKVAMENVTALKDMAEDSDVKKRLVALLEDWDDQFTSTHTELSISRQKLQQLQSERRTIGGSVREIFDLFFRSRGRNLILAIIASFTFWLVFRRVFSVMQRVSPFHKGELSMKVRIFNVLYLAFTGFGGVVVFLLVLFFFGDWVLLTIALMLIIGAIWSSKEAIPRYWAQALLLLNMGQVREGERVILDGIPWKVERLNYYTLLSNPRLGGETLRLPLDDMIELRSRPSHDKEPWFPTQHSDWIILSDETFGKIVMQTHNMVELVLLGGSRKTYQVADFLSNTPLVLSKGFRHNITFGVDYGHQAISTTSIPETLKEFVFQGLVDKEYSVDDFSLKVEFKEAGASSLNIAVIADFKGPLASKYKDLERLINRLCVDACNEHGWTIPFDQLTVHMAANAAS